MEKDKPRIYARVAERERVDPLANVTIAPDRVYAAPRVYQRTYGAARVYDTVRTYAAPRRYRRPPRNYDTPRPPRVRRNVVVVRVPRRGGDLLWMEARDFEQCLQDCVPEGLYMLGDVFDFTDAAWESYDQWEDWEPDEMWRLLLCAGPIDSEKDTFTEPERFHDSPLWNDVPALVAEVRTEALAHPEVIFTGDFQMECARSASIIAGEVRVRSVDDVAAAYADDPDAGLGGAVLDHAVWEHPAWFGPAGVRLAQMFEEINQDEYVNVNPAENLIFHVDDLHPGTDVQQGSKYRWWRIFGDYVVTDITYHGNREDKIAVPGWRQLHLSPYGEVVKPTFTNDDPTKPGWIEL